MVHVLVTLGAILAHANVFVDWQWVVRLITALTYHSVVACTIHEIARAAAC